MRHTGCVERASIDEAFIDLTEDVDRRILNGFFPTPDQLSNTVIAGKDGSSDPPESVNQSEILNCFLSCVALDVK